MSRTSFRRVLIAAFALVLGAAGVALPASAAASADVPANRIIVEGVNARSGPTSGGISVVVQGFNLRLARAVYFGGAPAGHFTVSDRGHTLTVTEPKHAAGKVHVYVLGPNGRSAGRPANEFTYVIPPHVTGVTPSSGDVAAGTIAYIHGDHFTPADGVFFGGSFANQEHITDTSIRLVVPPHKRGVVHLYLETEWTNRLPVSSRVTYRYTEIPSLTTGPSPAYSSTEGGQTITLTGHHLSQPTAVTFGGVPGAVLSSSESSLTVRTPPHAAGSTAVVVTNGDGSTPVSRTAQLVYQPAALLRTATPTLVEPPHADLVAVSCAGAGFCVAVGADGGYVVWNGTAWSARQSFSLADNDSLRSIVCVSSSFCMAGSAYASYEFDGTSWRRTPSKVIALDSPACLSPTFCMAVGGGDYAVFNGQDWNTVGRTNANTSRVSCVTRTYCVASTDVGAAVWNGKTWAASADPSSSTMDAISCPAVANCVLVGLGRSYVLHGATWTPEGDIDSRNGVGKLQCSSVQHCFLTDNTDRTFAFDGTSWTLQTAANRDLSCWSADACTGVLDGSAVTWNGSAWSAPTPVEQLQKPFRDVECATDTLCVAIDTVGNVETFDGTSWSAPSVVDGGQSLTALSCAPGSGFCVIGDQSGNVLSYRSGDWMPLAGLSGAVASLSCPTADFCMATAGRVAYEWDGTTWSATTGGQSLFAAVCPTTTMCLAMGEDDQAHRYDGTAWSTVPWPGDMPNGIAVASLSCASATFCMADDGYSTALTFDGEQWHSAAAGSDIPLGSLTCTPWSKPDVLCAVTDGSSIATYDGTQWSAPRAIAAPDGQALHVEGIACGSTMCMIWTSEGYIVRAS